MLGYYAIALQLASIPLDKTSGILSQIAFPAYSSIQNDKNKVSQYFLKAVRIVSFIFIPLMWGISSLGQEIINIVLGAKWSVAIIPFQLIALIIPLRMINSMTQPLLDGIGRPDLSLTNLLVACIIMPIGFYVGSLSGLTGISITWLVLFPVVFVYNLYTTLSCIGLNIRDVLSVTRSSLLSGVCMYGAICLLKSYIFHEFNVYSGLALSVIAGVVIYLGMMFFLNRKYVEEVFIIFKDTSYNCK